MHAWYSLAWLPQCADSWRLAGLLLLNVLAALLAPPPVLDLFLFCAWSCSVVVLFCLRGTQLDMLQAMERANQVAAVSVQGKVRRLQPQSSPGGLYALWWEEEGLLGDLGRCSA